VAVVNSQLQLIFLLLAMVKKNKKSRNAAGLLKKVNKPNPKRKEKQRELHSQKFAKYQIKKAEEQQVKDTIIRQPALKKMGMPVEQQEFGFKDHRELYNYAQERAPHHQPPIRTIDASVAPPQVTSYPEYPRLEFSSPPAFDIHGLVQSKRETVLNATAPRDAARLDRAKKIFHLNRA
jgi:hypothetical protein